MDRLKAMRLLVEAVESGSFSAAGRKLNVPLPTVSRIISDLETHLGTRLLVRSTRNLTLNISSLYSTGGSSSDVSQCPRA